jgi:hypothetical protein
MWSVLIWLREEDGGMMANPTDDLFTVEVAWEWSKHAG